MMTLTARLRFLLTRPLRDVTDAGLWNPVQDPEFLLTRPLRDVTKYDETLTERKNFYSHAPYGT